MFGALQYIPCYSDCYSALNDSDSLIFIRKLKCIFCGSILPFISVLLIFFSCHDNEHKTMRNQNQSALKKFKLKIKLNHNTHKMGGGKWSFKKCVSHRNIAKF